MTKNKFGQLKFKLLILVTAFFMLFSCLFFLSACNNSSSTTDEDPTYTYTEEDDGQIKNANFKFEALNYNLKDFPITVPTGWNKAEADNSSYASETDSGIVNVSDGAWKELVSTLYDDESFYNYLEDRFNFSEDSIKQLIRNHKQDQDYVPTLTEIKDYVLENIVLKSNGFTAPGKYSDTADNFVYMINNYSDVSACGGVGQKVTSTSTVTLKEGKIYKLSVWVKCNPDVVGLDTVTNNFGANIRISNNFNSNKQNEFKISNIKNTDWTEYSIYISSDKNYTCDLTLSLGLGYGDGANKNAKFYTRGTAFFDNISFEEVSALPSGIASYNMIYNSEDASLTEVDCNSTNLKSFAYNMDFENSLLNAGSYVSNLTLSKEDSNDKYFTISNVDNKTSKEILGVNANSSISSQLVDGVLGLTLNNASATIKIDNPAFLLDNGNYAYVSFKVKGDLTKFGSQDVTVDVRDIYGTTTIKRAAQTTLKTDGEWTIVGLYIKNNFDGSNYLQRRFGLDVVVGPTDIKDKIASQFATGTFEIKDLQLSTGVIKTDEDEDLATPIIYNLHKFFKDNASATTSLYAGYEADFSPEEQSTFAFSNTPSDIGTILTGAADVKGYSGIVSNHTYIKNQDGQAVLETKVNSRKGSGDTSGVAGLINTKYLNAYKSINGLSDIETAIGDYGDKDIQPIMIYNNDGTSYGFIGEKNVVTASQFALVSVKLKVVDKDATNKANAYVYLVDVSGMNKSVLTFTDFTVNNDKCDVAKDTQIDGTSRQLMLKVDDTDGEFITLNFYIATGNKAKEFRVEVWNGDREQTIANSFGYVFVEDITVKTSSGFSEAESYNATFNSSENPLGLQTKNAFNKAGCELITYQRELTELEKQFNSEYPKQQVSYKTKYIWAKNDTTIYAIYNSVEPVAIDPYENIEEPEQAGGGCASNTDPSTFWLSFSSVLLGVALIMAIIALFVKNIRRRRKAYKKDAKVHYSVKSRISYKKDAENKKAKDFEEEEIYTATVDSVEEESETEQSEDDSYIYGEVQSFDQDDENK